MINRDHKKIFKAIEAHEFISLDIFDTLVFRLTHHPADVFSMMHSASRKKLGLQIDDLAAMRVRAEDKARLASRAQGKDEVCLEEIYHELRSSINLNEQDTSSLMELEMELELGFIRLTQFGRSVIEYAAANPEKRFILTSDMYLDRIFIDRVLDNLGINFHETLLLSSEVGRTKHHGELYYDVIDHFGCQPKEILHIGDNFEADIKRSNSLGLRGCHIEPSRSVFSDPDVWSETRLFSTNYGPKVLFNAIFAEQSGVSEFKNWHETLDRSPQKYQDAIGSLVFAPLLVSLCIWLKETLEHQNVSKINFLARDGQIVYRVFKLLYGDQFDVGYISASRRMLTLPFTILNSEEIRNFHVDKFEQAQILGDIVDGFDNNSMLTKRLVELGIDLEAKATTENVRELELQLIENSGLIQLSLADERRHVSEYLKFHFATSQRVALFDLGWRGSLQRAIGKAVPELSDNIVGLYFGTTDEAIGKLGAEGLAYQSFSMHDGFPEYFRHCCQSYTDVLEFLFSADHPSVKTVVSVDDSGFENIYQPICENEEKSQKIALGIQEAAFVSIETMLDEVSIEFLEMVVDKNLALNDFFSFVDHPDKHCAQHLKDVYVFSGVGDQKGNKLIDVGAPTWVVNRMIQSRWKSAFHQGLSKMDRRVLLFLDWSYYNLPPVKFIYDRFLAR